MKVACPECGQHYSVDIRDIECQFQCIKCNGLFSPYLLPDLDAKHPLPEAEIETENVDYEEIYEDAIEDLLECEEIKKAPPASIKRKIIKQLASGDIAEDDILDWLKENAEDIISSCLDLFKKEYPEKINTLIQEKILSKRPSTAQKNVIFNQVQQGKINSDWDLVQHLFDNNLELFYQEGFYAVQKRSNERIATILKLCQKIPDRQKDEPPLTERQASYIKDLGIHEDEVLSQLGKRQASFLIDDLNSHNYDLLLSIDGLRALSREEINDYLAWLKVN